MDGVTLIHNQRVAGDITPLTGAIGVRNGLPSRTENSPKITASIFFYHKTAKEISVNTRLKNGSSTDNCACRCFQKYNLTWWKKVNGLFDIEHPLVATLEGFLVGHEILLHGS